MKTFHSMKEPLAIIRKPGFSKSTVQFHEAGLDWRVFVALVCALLCGGRCDAKAAATITVNVYMEHCTTNTSIAWRVGFPNDDCDLSYANNFLDLTVDTPKLVFSEDEKPGGCRSAVCEWSSDSVTWYPAVPPSQMVSATMIFRIGPESCSKSGNAPEDPPDKNLNLGYVSTFNI